MLFYRNPAVLMTNQYLELAHLELTALYCEALEQKLSTVVSGDISITVDTDSFTVNIKNYDIDFYSEVTNVYELSTSGYSTSILCNRIIQKYKQFLHTLFFK